MHGLTQLNAPLSAHTRTFPVAGDNTGPTIAWATPANGALLPGSRISGTIKATDPSGVTIALLNHYDAPKFAASIPAGTDGKHMITWWVADGVGHSRYLTRTVTVDNTGTSLTTSARTWHR
ncbi:hypothetical protein ACIA5C_46855 [Actinoplanes sp. NPDC051343]|uniref:hypothetical protein n=1 Tax=Actinoplanes sp. NPDC051343 TaxID=3363906 RepID=UPI00378CC072